MLQTIGLTAGGMLQWAVSMAASGVAGYATGRLIAHSAPGEDGYQRGAVLIGATSPGRSRAARDSSAGLHLQRSAGSVRLAGVSLSSADEGKHFKIIGTTGTGKSTAIAELLDGALRRGDRAVIADPDGGYLRRFYDADRGDVILNPFDERAVRWDLFSEIERPYDVEQIARSLLPDHEGSDRSWRAYARTFFTAVTRQAHAGGIRDVGELYRLLVIADAGELRALTGGTPAQPFLDEQNGRMFDSIRSVTSSAVSALEHVSEQRGPAFSIRQWTRRGPGQKGGVLFIPYSAGQIAALRSMISAWMRIAIFEAMERPEGDQRLWFVVDELDALGPIDGLKDASARLRKFGGRCVLGFQSIAQVAGTYGVSDAHTIVENCGNTLILRCSASEGGGTARFASTLIGQREVVRISESRSRRPGVLLASVTRSEQLRTEPAVMDSQIEQLPDLVGYLKCATRGYWQQVALMPGAAQGPGIDGSSSGLRRHAQSRDFDVGGPAG
jgi:type IV secretory pathway TraG/TraD family ATPase VirD4